MAPDPETSQVLFERARTGDAAALERLCARFLPRLERWATGRLPVWARDLIDTRDLAQETLLRVVKRMTAEDLGVVHQLNGYMRQALLNRILEEMRRARRRPEAAELDSGLADRAASALEETIGRETADRYEAALARLKPEEREAIVARIEMNQSYEEVAEALGKPSPDAARMAVSRALLRLAREMKRDA